MTFSPLRDQPHYIYRVDEQVGDILEAAERCYPGVLAYGHYNHSRKWNRLTKLEGGPPEPFHYFHIFVPLNCAWLFEDFVGEYVTPKVEHAINVEDIFAWPDDPDALETMVKYGRELARRYAAEGELRDFVPDMMTDYQARGVYWAATRPWSKLVYPCGAGKTLTAIMSALTRRGPVAIIAPAKARRVWWDQVQEYTHCVPLRVVPDGQRRKGDQTIPEYVAECHAAGVRPWVIMGAQSLPDYVDRLVDVQPRTLIYDELHTFGQPKRWVAIHQSDGSVEFEKRKTTTNTRETRAVAAMEASRMECLQLRVGLTATPLDDGRPRRLWSQLDLLAPGAYSMGYGAFAKRYCGAQEGQWGGLDDKGSSNIPELKARASYLMQEVTHTESHGQLPPTRVQVVWLEHGDQNRPVAFRKIINAAEKQAAKTHSVFDRERALEANLMEAASRKRRYIIEEVLEGLSGGGKVVLFTARRQDCEDWASVVHKALQKAVKKGQYHGVMPSLWWGHGGVDDREREDMVSEFRSSKGPCVLIATGQAFGESVDGLQTADLAIFAMLPWRPGDFEQWKGRFDRIGGSPTLLKVVLAKGTYDERVAGLLADKIAPIKEFLAAEQYQGLDTKLLGIDDHEKMRAGLLAMLFNPEGE